MEINLDEYTITIDEDVDRWAEKTRRLIQMNRSLNVRNIEITEIIQKNLEVILTANQGLNRIKEIENDTENDSAFYKRKLTTKVENGVTYYQIFTDGTLINSTLRNAYQIYGGGIFFFNDCELNASIVFQKNIKSLFEAEIGAAVIALHQAKQMDIANLIITLDNRLATSYLNRILELGYVNKTQREFARMEAYSSYLYKYG